MKLASAGKMAGRTSATGQAQEPETPSREAPQAAEAQQWSGHMCVDAVATSGPQPRAKLHASNSGLQLSGSLGDFKLSPTAITSVRRAGFYPWLWGGIRIRHSVPGYPERLQFYPVGIHRRQVLEQLKELGFKVE